MATTTTSPAVRKYDPSDPHFHYRKAYNAIDDLYDSIPFEHRTEIIGLINKAVTEAFIRGMNPSQPFD